MTDPTAGEPPPEVGDAPVPPSPGVPRSPPRWWQRWKLMLAIVLLIPVVLIGMYLAIALSWSYSEGQRAGYLQKFSRKGWICKTWEGELAMTTVPGVSPTLWNFTVRKAATARQLTLALARRVVLYYQEHRGLPGTCFGETAYFVDSARIVP